MKKRMVHPRLKRLTLGLLAATAGAVGLVAHRAAADSGTAAAPSAAGPVDFAKDVQPIFAAKCYDCHGPAKQKGGIRLDAAAALKGGDSGDPLLVAGDPEKSHLIKLVRGEGGSNGD